MPAPARRRKIRLIHTSDTHLGDDWNPDAAAGAFSAVVDGVHRLAGDALLIAGDVFDHARIPDAVLEFFVAEMARAAVPAVILPGNHDLYDAASLYHRRPFAAAPDNLHLITATRGALLSLPALTLDIWGRAMDCHTPAFRPLQGIPTRRHNASNGDSNGNGDSSSGSGDCDGKDGSNGNSRRNDDGSVNGGVNGGVSSDGSGGNDRSPSPGNALAHRGDSSDRSDRPFPPGNAPAYRGDGNVRSFPPGNAPAYRGDGDGNGDRNGDRDHWLVAMAHGHFHYPDDTEERSSPIRPHEIAAAACDYIALGHWERFEDVSQNGVTAYYSGSPMGASPARGQVAVNVIDLDGQAATPVSVTQARLPIG